MPLLSRINTIKNLKFFKDFKWLQNNCDRFGQCNIIYGFNGSGKTTLADFFHCLEDKENCSEFFSQNSAEFELTFADSPGGDNPLTIKHKKNLSRLPQFKVFHSDYIKETVQKNSSKGLGHIYTIGADHKQKLDKILLLKELEITLSSRLEDARSRLKESNEKYDDFIKKQAKEIKDWVHYNDRFSYNKSHYIKDLEQLLDTPTLSLTPKDIKDLRQSINSEIKEKATFIPYVPTTKLSSDELLSLLSQSPSNKAIEGYLQNPAIAKWAGQGVEIHESIGSQKCQFCDSFISNERWEALTLHFDTSYKELMSSLDKAIKEFDNIINNYQAQLNKLPIVELLYKELQEECFQRILGLTKLIKNNIDILEKIKQLLLLKKDNLTTINLVSHEDISRLFSNLILSNSIYDDIFKIIAKHNAKSDDFEDLNTKAREQLKTYLLLKNRDEYLRFLRDIKALEEILLELSSDKNIISEQILYLERNMQNYIKMKDEINKDIRDFFGREEIALSAEDNCYRITRNGETVDKLSKGEENALALIYFFNSLSGKEADPQNTIVILDDPISSFDSSFYYHAVAYIYSKTVSLNQIFIFTHKFSFYKQLLKTYTSPKQYILKRNNGSPMLSNPDEFIKKYTDEYAFFFSLIYEFVSTDTQDENYLYMSNIGRQVLESFLCFKIPKPQKDENSSCLTLALELSGETVTTRAALRLLNDKSHQKKLKGTDSSDSFASLDEIKQTLKDLLAFIREYDRKHFSSLENVLPLHIPRLFLQEQSEKISILVPSEIAIMANDITESPLDNASPHQPEYTIAAHRESGINELSEDENEQLNNLIEKWRVKYKI